jgi:alpha-tubulin suppressor-like RCC1 family protein
MGDGTDKGSSSPQLVVALKDERVTQVCCGTRHTAVLTGKSLQHLLPHTASLVLTSLAPPKDKGEVYAWGFNAFGQVSPLGDGVISGEGSNVLVPTKVGYLCPHGHLI